MVKITIEYGSVEEAIQALGKMSGLAKVRRAASTVGVPAVEERTDKADTLAPAAPATITKNLELPDTSRTRKGRADKGKPRGPHKEAAAGSTGGAPVSSPDQAPVAKAPLAPAGAAPQEPAAASPVPASTEPVPSEVAQPLPTEADVQAATEALFAATNKSIGIVTGIMAEFGVRKLRELKPEQRAAYIKRTIEDTPKAAA